MPFPPSTCSHHHAALLLLVKFEVRHAGLSKPVRTRVLARECTTAAYVHLYVRSARSVARYQRRREQHVFSKFTPSDKTREERNVQLNYSARELFIVVVGAVSSMWLLKV